MPVTIKDVAALAGVSPSTVSRTCKDHPSISRQTKEKVRQAMEQLGYEPNFQASSLATQNSRTIGIILPPSQKEAYENSFYLEVIRGISQYCNQKQYINTVITGQNEEEILAAVKIMAKKGQAEGHIVLYSKEQDPVIDYLYDEGLLYVLIGKAYRNVNQTIYVDNDNVLADRLPVRGPLPALQQGPKVWLSAVPGGAPGPLPPRSVHRGARSTRGTEPGPGNPSDRPRPPHRGSGQRRHPGHGPGKDLR